MKEDEYFLNEVLVAVHSAIKISGVEFDTSRCEELDKEIESYIRETINIIDEKDNEKIKFRGHTVNRKALVPIVIRYYALYNDNLELLDRLKNFKFDIECKLNLYPLDRNLSSKFPLDKYVELLNNQEIVFRRFYGSLWGLDNDKKSQVLETFCDLINKKNDIAIDKKKDNNDEDKYLVNLMCEKNFDYFGKDFLLNSSLNQRKVINSLDFHLRDEYMDKVFELIKRYRNYYSNLNLCPEVLDCLTIDEIASLSYKDVKLYNYASKRNCGLVNKLHDVLGLNPNFNCDYEFFKPEIFKSICADDMAFLSEYAMTEIERIRMPAIKNVIVMPIRKINRIISKDNKMKKKLAAQEAKMHR